MKTIIPIIIVIAVIAGITIYSQNDKQPIDDGGVMVKNDDAMMKDLMSYTVTVEDLSSTQPLAPGAIIVHDPKITFDFSGTQAPASFEKLAEIGDPTEFIAEVAAMEGVRAVYSTDAPIHPTESADYIIKAGEGDVISVLSMAVASNDGYALVSKLDVRAGNSAIAVNHDAGFEDNTELGSGFDGGQPDPSRGAANIENGTTTSPQANVTTHTQLTENIMKVSINKDADSIIKDDAMMMKDDVMEKDTDAMMKDDEPVAMEKSGSYLAYEDVDISTLEGNIVLDFYAPWCPSCRALEGNIKANLNEIPSDLTILKVDYDSESDLKRQYGVTRQHTLVQVDQQGNKIALWTGGNTLASVVAKVQ